MVRKRTEAVAARYGLNEEQKAKLLELNTRYADSIRVGMRVQGGRRMPAGDRMKTNAMKRYDEKLKGIMTSEQYQKYTEDMNKRMQRQARPRNGMRQ